MVDFVIKPTTGNLKIQDDQDVDRIVIAPTTGVTTLSNPTLTAPTIASMANCTFPAGHVIRTLSTVRTTAGELITQSLTATPVEINLGGLLEITSFSATDGNTLILTTGGFTADHDDDGTYRTEIIFFKDSTPIGSTSLFTESNNHRVPVHLEVVIGNISGYSSVDISVRAQYQTGASATMNIVADGNNDEQGDVFPFLMIQEIQG